MTRIDPGRRRAEDDERRGDDLTDAEMRLRARVGLALFLVAALAIGAALIMDGFLT